MKRQFLYILLLMVGCIVQAQMPQLLPMPQKVSFTGKYVRAGVPVREVLVPEVPGAEFQDEAYHLTVGRDGVTIEAVTTPPWECPASTTLPTHGRFLA